MFVHLRRLERLMHHLRGALPPQLAADVHTANDREHFNILPTGYQPLIPPHWCWFSMFCLDSFFTAHQYFSSRLLTVKFQVSFLNVTWEDAKTWWKSVNTRFSLSLFFFKKTNILRSKQQHVNAGFWLPWMKQLLLQHGCKDAHCISFFSLFCVYHFFCLDMSYHQ